MKPAEAESSSGLRDHQTRLTNFEPTTTIFQLPKEKKIIPRRSIDSNCPDTRTVCYGSDVCTNNFGSGSRVCADDVGSRGGVVYAPRCEAGRNHHRCHNVGHHDETETADTHQAHDDLSAASLPLTTSYWS